MIVSFPDLSYFPPLFVKPVIMQWRGRRQSSNVDDQRGRGRAGGTAFKGGLGMVVVVLLISLIMGENPLTLLQSIESQTTSAPSTQETQWQPTTEDHTLQSQS